LIVKCSHCKQFFAEENFDAHECDLPLKECRRIEVVYFHDDSYQEKKLMTGWGTNGILYTFEVVPRKAIPISLSTSDGFLQRKKPDKDFTEPVFHRLQTVC
jgi:hypothetical protein